MVITAGTKAYNMCFVADQSTTVQSVVPGHDALCVLVHVDKRCDPCLCLAIGFGGDDT